MCRYPGSRFKTCATRYDMNQKVAMTWTDLIGARGERRFDRRVVLWSALGYPLLYAWGYLSKTVAGSAAIWPADALTFAAYILLPIRLWPLVALGTVSWELMSRPLLYWATSHSHPGLTLTLSFAAANILTAVGPATLARAMHLLRRQNRFELVISPLWIVALFAGSAPGALIGALTSADAAGIPLVQADVGLWLLSSVLTIVTFGPMVFGLLVGFSEPTLTPARPWEGWAISSMILALFICFAVVPWPAVEAPVEPMLFAVPLVWLALRFSRRTTNIGVVIVASGVVFFAGYGVGIYRDLANIDGWRHVVISIDVFLVIGCGGALLVNLMTVKQRALLDELEREHLSLRDYARALTVAEETARRKTAADLHDGIGQVLAGQSMTLAAMRVHASHLPLAVLLEEAAEASREAQEGLRVMIQDLSPPGLDHASLDETLRWLAEFFKTRFGFRVAWRVTGITELSRDRLRLVYRCVRELLMNARKHSQRQSAEVEVDVSPLNVEITVVDEGIGFDSRLGEPLSGNQFGLAQLRERVHAAGGTLDVDAVVGEGCRVTVRLPAPTPQPG
jgi:signal transduction histidine kinase